MKEFKFRAWSNKWDKMIYPNDKNIHIDVHANTAWDDCIDDEGIQLSQYTGLTDKNNIDIYEGDILYIDNEYVSTILKHSDDITDNSEILVEIRYLKPCVMGFGWMGWTYLNREDYGFFTLERLVEMYIKKKGKIIGNIYENPELLKNNYND